VGVRYHGRTLRPQRSSAKDTQHEMKKILPIILTVTVPATAATAGLGWSLDECIQHYGEPEYTNSDPFTGLLWYHFKTEGFEIQALLNNARKVVGITYLSHEMFFGKDLKMVPGSTRHGLTPSIIQMPMPTCTAL
jgi:hypothetical protein